jgi:hypothetical protein
MARLARAVDMKRGCDRRIVAAYVKLAPTTKRRPSHAAARHMAAADSHYHFAVSREIWAGAVAPDPLRHRLLNLAGACHTPSG